MTVEVTGMCRCFGCAMAVIPPNIACRDKSKAKAKEWADVLDIIVKSPSRVDAVDRKTGKVDAVILEHKSAVEIAALLRVFSL